MDPHSPQRAIVAGAGIAGLRVAHGLYRAGWEVVVLEARDRVGGRLLSVPPAGPERGVPRVALDLGASWFWPNEPRVQALVRELGLSTHPQHLAGAALYDDPGGVQRLPGNPLDVASGRFSAGADGLALGLAELLPSGVVRLNAAVRRIENREREVFVEVEFPHGLDSLAADHVVVAVPPALALHRISFEPGLPAEVQAVAAATPVWMGATAKVVAEYSRPFWRDAGLAGAAVSHLGPLREIHDMSGPDGVPAALFGFASTALTPAGTITDEDVVAQLIRLFGAEAATPRRVTIMDWRAEEWTSPPGVERQQGYELFGHPVFRTALHGRIHFASTETAPAFGGHIEGALLAADLVVERLGAHAG